MSIETALLLILIMLSINIIVLSVFIIIVLLQVKKSLTLLDSVLHKTHKTMDMFSFHSDALSKFLSKVVYNIIEDGTERAITTLRNITKQKDSK